MMPTNNTTKIKYININPQEGLFILKFCIRKFQIAWDVSQVDLANNCHTIDGKVTKDTENMIGIIPAWFILIGK